MKRIDLERRLKELGYWEVDGGKHGKWTNGVHTEPVPRAREIKEHTAKAILKRCEAYKVKH